MSNTDQAPPALVEKPPRSPLAGPAPRPAQGAPRPNLRPAPAKLGDADYAKLDLEGRAAYARSHTTEGRRVKSDLEKSPNDQFADQQAETAAYEARYDPTARPDDSPAGDRGDVPADQLAADPDTPTIKLGEHEFSEKELAGLMERHALEQSRKATLPATPADYKLDLPPNFVPQGMEVSFDANDPVLRDAQAFAHREGLSQSQFTQMLQFHAQTRIDELKHVQDLHRAELDKLGANAATRVDAVTTWLKGQFGAEIARPFAATLVHESQVRGWEKIMERFRTQGAGGYSPQFGEVRESGKVSQAQYDAMSPAERVAYAQQFPQPHQPQPQRSTR